MPLKVVWLARYIVTRSRDINALGLRPSKRRVFFYPEIVR